MPNFASLPSSHLRYSIVRFTLMVLLACGWTAGQLAAADSASTGEASPTASADTLPPATLGVALHTYISGNQVTFDYVIRNLGDDEITGITLQHPLNDVFGSGNYSIQSQPTLLEGSDTLTLSGQFFGFSIFSRLITDGSLAPGAYARFRTVVGVTSVTDQGNGIGVYPTQVTVNGTNSNSDALSDLSDYGINPDPNGDGSADGAGEDDITTINLSEARALGAALDATVNNTAITLDVYLENLGSGTLSSLALPLDLDAVFGAGNYSITSAPTFVDDPGTLTLNGAWDGSGTTALLAGGGTLATSDTAQIRLVINLDTVSDQGDGEGIYFLQTFASGTAPFGSLAIDLTDAGTDPDPNGNSNPADAGESDPVSLDFAQPTFTLADGTGNDTHGTGASINLVATFSKAVTVTGTPRIAITIGTETRYATYNAGPSDATSVVFTYNIQAGDNDADGIAVGSSIDLNGGTIQADNNGYDAILSFTAPDLSGVIVSTNEAPTDITLSGASINQSTSARANVGTLTATDTDSGDSHTFNLVDGEGDTSNTLFAITDATLSVSGTDPVSPGSYSVRIQATDASGETFQKAFTITVVDDIAPAAPTNVALDGASDSGANGADNLTNDNTPTITGTSEPFATIYLDFEGGFIGIGAADANGDFAVTADALDDGVYPIQVYAGDQAGNNSGPSATLTFTVDTTAPDAPATPSLSLVDDTGVSFSDGITNRVRPSIQGIASADATVAVYFNDTVVGLVTAGPSGLWTFTPDSDLAEGLTTVAAIVIDSAGNASAPSGELSVTVDTTAPVITSVNQINTTYGEPIDYTLTAAGDPVSFTHTGLPDELSLDSSTGVLSLIGNLPASNRELTLIATDAAGNNGSLALNFFVAQRPIDVSGFTAIDRVYDATAIVQVDSSNAQFTNLVDGDDVSVDATSTFAYAKGKASVGTIGLAVSVSLTGTDAGNYYLNTPASVTATITPAPLDVTGILIPNKVYDGTTAATLDTTSAALSGVLESNDRSPPTGGELTAPNLEFHAATQPQPSGPDDVTLVTDAASATFASANAGTGIAVTVEGLELSGADAGNYELVLPAITADISPAPLTVSTEPAGRFYGDPNPELELTYTGFVNNEDESVLTGEPDLTLDATRSSPVGEYVVEVELGTLAAANYSLTTANGVLSISLGHHFADTDRNYQIDLGELLRVIELYNFREGTVRTGAYRSDEETEDRYAPGDGDRIVPHTADSNGDGRISLVELTRVIQLYNVRQGDSRTGAYRPSKSSEDGFEPNLRSTEG